MCAYIYSNIHLVYIHIAYSFNTDSMANFNCIREFFHSTLVQELTLTRVCYIEYSLLNVFVRMHLLSFLNFKVSTSSYVHSKKIF